MNPNPDRFPIGDPEDDWHVAGDWPEAVYDDGKDRWRDGQLFQRHEPQREEDK